MAKKLNKDKRKRIIAHAKEIDRQEKLNKQQAELERNWSAFEDRQNRAYMACYCF